VLILLAVAAGTYLYISASDLIPETHETGRANKITTLVAFAVGVLLMILIGLIFAE